MMRGEFFVRIRHELGHTIYTWRLRVNGKIYALTRCLDTDLPVSMRRIALEHFDREFIRDMGAMEPQLDRLGRIARAVYPEPLRDRMLHTVIVDDPHKEQE
jgi:hypothetical protein